MQRRIVYLFILLTCFIFITNSNYAIAGDSTKTHKTTTQKKQSSDISLFIEDIGAFYSAPFHFSGKQWLYSAGVVSGVVLSMTLDKQVKKSISIDTASNYNNDFWDIPTYYGSIWTTGIGSIGIYTLGLITRSNSIRITGRLLMESVAIAVLTTYTIKVITGRNRPYITDNQWKFDWFEKSEEKTAFPSGHSAAAFAFSTVLAERIDTWWARVGFYSLGAMTAYARVRNNQHWFSDALTGSLLGFGTGFFLVHRENEREKKIKTGKKGGNKLSFYPSLDGVQVVYDF
jgi:membrane-associated phospholipid phosphatase